MSCVVATLAAFTAIIDNSHSHLKDRMGDRIGTMLHSPTKKIGEDKKMQQIGNGIIDHVFKMIRADILYYIQ